jgi:hypothetical protein
MSKYTVVETSFKDAECLVQALHELGYTDATFHEKALHLTGYQGDTRTQTAEVIVRRSVKGGLGESSNDLGFKRNAEGNYEALISDYDRGFLGSNFVPRLQDAYAEINTKKTALIQGLRFVQRTVNEQGEIALEFAVM